MSAPGEATPLVGRSHKAMWIRTLTTASAIAEGYDIGAFAGVVVIVKEDWDLSASQVGVLVSILYAFTALGSLFAGWLADRLGRRIALAIVYVILTVSTALMALAQSYGVLVLGRMLCGVGVGLGISCVSMYVSEIAPASQRGLFGSLEEFFINAGILLGFFANVALQAEPSSWRWMLGLGCLPPLIALAGLATGFFPESPRYLQLVGRSDEARAVLATLVDPKEAETTLEAWREDQDKGRGGSFAGCSGLWSTPKRLRMTLAGVGCGAMQMLSGISIVTNLSSLLMSQHFSEKAAFEGTLLMGVVKTAAIVTVTFWVLDNVGRRPLLLTSAAGMSVGAVGLGVVFGDAERFGLWACTLALSVFCVAFSIGFGPVTYCYVPEVFDSAVRGQGIAFAFCSSRLMSASILAVVPMLLESIGAKAIFFLFAALNATFIGYVFMFCPETKQRKLEDMHQLFD